MSKINDMIKKESGRKLEILKELKRLNKDGYLFMTQRGSTFKPKYRALQKTDTWRKAKQLLMEYFTIERTTLRCDMCKALLKNPVMHHAHYDPVELFSPKNISFLHKKCHSKTHTKY